MSQQTEFVRQLSLQSTVMKDKLNKAVPHGPTRALTSLVLSLVLLNSGDVMVKGVGDPVSSILGSGNFNGLHFEFRDPIPPREDGGRQNMGYRVRYVLSHVKEFTDNFSPRTIRPLVAAGWDGLNDKLDQIQDQMQTQEGRTELGYYVWGQPVNPNLMRESVGHLLQFGGFWFALMARDAVKKDDQIDTEEEEE